MSKLARVCLFGGTFDPIHQAHLHIAREAEERCALDRILFVPAGRPPHKEGDQVTPFEHRYRMVEAACAGHPSFEPSRLEEPPHSSYSIDTVKRLYTELEPNTEVTFLIGSDAFDEIESWKQWHDLSQLVKFIVAARPGSQYKIPAGTRVQRLNSLALEVSSSDIRSSLAEGKETDKLPKSVLAYIKQNHLYGWQSRRS